MWPCSAGVHRYDGFVSKKHPFWNDLVTHTIQTVILQAFDNIGDDFDLCRDDIDFTDDGAVICGEVVLLPPRTVDPEHLAGYL
jgi:hypothetical protein